MFNKFVKKFSNWKAYEKKVDNLQTINNGDDNWWEYVGRPHVEVYELETQNEGNIDTIPKSE